MDIFETTVFWASLAVGNTFKCCTVHTRLSLLVTLRGELHWVYVQISSITLQQREMNILNSLADCDTLHCTAPKHSGETLNPISAARCGCAGHARRGNDVLFYQIFLNADTPFCNLIYLYRTLYLLKALHTGIKKNPRCLCLFYTMVLLSVSVGVDMSKIYLFFKLLNRTKYTCYSYLSGFKPSPWAEMKAVSVGTAELCTEMAWGRRALCTYYTCQWHAYLLKMSPYCLCALSHWALLAQTAPTLWTGRTSHSNVTSSLRYCTLT